jgi:hypothetical protein
MSKFLLEVVEKVGVRYSASVNLLVEATDPGYAKYHWHKLQNQNGGSKDGDDAYTFDSAGYRAELKAVREVSDEELDVLEDVLYEIPGFDPE